MAKAAKTSSKPSTPTSNGKHASSTPTSNGSRGSRGKVMVKSFRESPTSDADSDADDDSDVSAFEADEAQDLSDARVGSEESGSGTESQEEEDSEEEDDIPKAKRRKVEGADAASKPKASPSNAPRGKNKEEFDEDGRIVTELVKAPKESIPPNQISVHLMNLMTDLCDPAKNDRDWFKARDPLWRYVEKNWNTFVSHLMDKLMDEVDDTLPLLPYKDLTYRIYRDVRLCHDKTPYRKKMLATFGRGGRKGGTDFATYHVEVGPGQTSVQGGWWSPSKENLDLIRRQIIDDTEHGRNLKEIVSSKAFVEMFGEPRQKTEVKKEKKEKGAKSSQEQKKVNLWGSKDELKKAPKMEGVTPDHPEIEWLKLKSFWVEKSIPDEDALKPDFQDRICEIAKVIQPLVVCLNEIVYPSPPPPPPEI